MSGEELSNLSALPKLSNDIINIIRSCTCNCELSIVYQFENEDNVFNSVKHCPDYEVIIFTDDEQYGGTIKIYDYKRVAKVKIFMDYIEYRNLGGFITTYYDKVNRLGLNEKIMSNRTEYYFNDEWIGYGNNEESNKFIYEANDIIKKIDPDLMKFVNAWRGYGERLCMVRKATIDHQNIINDLLKKQLLLVGKGKGR